MRPLYETPEDLAREREVADILEEAWSCSLHKLPLSYHLDFCGCRGKEILSFIEVKVRKCLPTTYRSIMLSLNKFQHGLHYAVSTGCPFLFVVAFKDGSIYHKNLCDVPEEFPLEFGGRTKNTRDDFDVEPCILIAMEDMKELRR